MWANEQEWRDQVIAQLIYLRSAIYFAGFVIALGLSAPYAYLLGFPEKYTPFIFLALMLFAIEKYWRANSKSTKIEKRMLSFDYDRTAD